MIILRSEPTFYDQRFARYDFWAILWLLGLISFAYQVNPKNRPSKYSETATVSEFAKIGRSPSIGRFLNSFYKACFTETILLIYETVAINQFWKKKQSWSVSWHRLCLWLKILHKIFYNSQFKKYNFSSTHRKI